MNKTFIIVPVCGQWKYTEEMLKSLWKHTDKSEYVLFFIDNNSQDETTKRLLDLGIDFIRNETNIGFAKAINQGMRRVNSEDILWLNNDVVLSENWLKKLKQCLYSEKKIAAVGPVTCHAASSQKIKGLNKAVYDRGLANRIEIENKDDPWRETNYITGFCFLIKNKVFRKIGYCDERFVLSGEDDDYCIRLKSVGYRIVICKNTYIHHYGHTTAKKQSTFNATLEWRKSCDMLKTKHGFTF